MKKFLAILLCVCMVVAIVACNKTDDTKTETPTTEAPTEAPTQAPDNTPEEPKEVEYKFGMGVVVAFTEGATQVDSTVAAVVTDANGKIVACRIDATQNKCDLTKISFDELKETEFQSKLEKGDGYNMATYGASMDNNGDGVVKEWYEQAKAFENWVVGKTAAEVAAMPTQTLDDTFGSTAGYVISADEALLAAGCTIQVGDFVEAVVAACKDEQGVSFKTAKTFTVGVAATSFATDSDESKGLVAMYTDYAAAVVVDGKIVAALNDAIQPKITVDAEGAVVSQSVGVTDEDGNLFATKRELKENYNMATFGASMDPNGDGKVLEWYLQSEAFSKHVVGMTGAEVAAMETAANSIGYQMTTDTDLLAAGCTIQITAIKAVVAKSVTNAR